MDSTSNERRIESMNADVARSANRAPCGPIWSATASALARDSRRRGAYLLGEAGERGCEHGAVLGGQHRTGDGDPDGGADLRVVSLTAEATPCFSSGTAFMIAEVVGATHKPMPAAVMIIGHDRSK